MPATSRATASMSNSRLETAAVYSELPASPPMCLAASKRERPPGQEHYWDRRATRKYAKRCVPMPPCGRSPEDGQHDKRQPSKHTPQGLALKRANALRGPMGRLARATQRADLLISPRRTHTRNGHAVIEYGACANANTQRSLLAKMASSAERHATLRRGYNVYPPTSAWCCLPCGGSSPSDTD